MVRDLAAATPASRNRVVDLLRAAAIVVVVLGHWLMAAVVVRDRELEARVVKPPFVRNGRVLVDLAH